MAEKQTAGRPEPEINDVFGDEHEVDAQDTDDDIRVADGLRTRPVDTVSSTALSSGNGDSLAVPSGSRSMIEDAGPSSARNSAFLESSDRNSFAMLHDGPYGAAGNPQRNPQDRPQKQVPAADVSLSRHLSTASSASFMTAARSQTPSTISPSHPYTMYPQATGMSRTASVVTASTVRPPVRSLSGQRPSHPYGLYPQNVIEGSEDDSVLLQPNFRVGFTGANSHYHRRIGPDGEEQDIVGPDGYTEQLPPYTLHAEDGPKSAEANSSPTVSFPVTARVGRHSSQDVILGTGGPVLLQDGQAESTALPSRARGQESEKSWREKSWREKRKTRVFGMVPLWLLVLLFAIILVCALILGAAIGSVLNKAREEENRVTAGEEVMTVTETLFDATIIPTPSDLPPVPTGVWSMFMGRSSEAGDNCLTDTAQHASWKCDVFGPPLRLQILPSPEDEKKFLASVDSFENDELLQYGVPLEYGVVPPKLMSRSMDLVEDFDERSRGPAFHFQARYDKVAVISDLEFAAGFGLRHRRHTTPNRARDSKDDRKVLAGHEPWICQWNNTFIEAFMYISQRTSNDTPPLSSGTVPSSTPSPEYMPPSQPEQTPPSATTAPQDEPMSIFSASPVTAAPVPTSSDDSDDDGDDAKHNKRMPHFADARSEKLRRYKERPPSLPVMMKIEERRLPDSPPPQCQKFVLQENGELVPKHRDDDENSLVIIELDEEPVDYSDYAVQLGYHIYTDEDDQGETSRRRTRRSKGRLSGRDAVENLSVGREEPPNSCHCQWMLPV